MKANETYTDNSTELTVTIAEVIEERKGYVIDDQGYRHDTYNLDVAEVIGDDGKRYFVAMDNGQMMTVDNAEDMDNLDEYLNMWDSEYVEVFKGENLIK